MTLTEIQEAVAGWSQSNIEWFSSTENNSNILGLASDNELFKIGYYNAAGWDAYILDRSDNNWYAITEKVNNYSRTGQDRNYF